MRPRPRCSAEPGLFVEAIVAPDFDADALEILTTQAQVEGQRAADEGRRARRRAAALDASAASTAAC